MPAYCIVISQQRSLQEKIMINHNAIDSAVIDDSNRGLLALALERGGELGKVGGEKGGGK